MSRRSRGSVRLWRLLVVKEPTLICRAVPHNTSSEMKIAAQSSSTVTFVRKGGMMRRKRESWQPGGSISW